MINNAGKTKKKNSRIDPIMAISIVCFIGFIPRKLFVTGNKKQKYRKLFVTGNKETKIL